MTDSVVRKFGYIPDLPDDRDHVFAFRGKPTDLPAQFSLKEFLGDVLDQGALGSCTANAISGALKLWMNKNNYKWPFTPSRLQIYYDERELEGTTQSDSGAMIRDGFKVINTVGAAPEDSNIDWSWPYSSTDERWREKPPEKCYTDAALHKCLEYKRVAHDERSVKQALLEGHALVIGIAVYQSFQSKEASRTGVIPMPHLFEQMLGGHALFLHGYGNHDDQHVDGRNSWGAEWGDGGDFHLPWKYLLDRRYCSDIWAVGLIT
jgi:C1A family cysteine protease